MNEFAQICYHLILRVLFSITEYSVITILITALILLMIGLVKASVFLWTTLASTYRLSLLLRNLVQCKDVLQLIENSSITGFVYIIPESGYKAAFTLGWLRPKVYLTDSLINNMEKNSLDIVIRHEFGHCRRRDPLIHLILQTLSEIFWFIPAVARYSKRYRLLSEVSCDNFAVLGGHDKLDVAKVLTSLAEKNSWAVPNPRPACNSLGDHLEIRIRSLLGQNIAMFITTPKKVLITSYLTMTLIFLSSAALLMAMHNPSEISTIRITAQSCDIGHNENDILAKLGLVCPHCGDYAYIDTQSITPTCHAN